MKDALTLLYWLVASVVGVYSLISVNRIALCIVLYMVTAPMILRMVLPSR